MWEEQVSFQDLMAERLKQAPWLVLSIGLHLVAFLLMYVLIPPEKKEKIVNQVQMTNTETAEIVEPPPPPPPETKLPFQYSTPAIWYSRALVSAGEASGSRRS